MVKREAELKSEAMKLIRAAGFLDLVYATAGAPDKALIRNGRTTNWEFKHGTPGFDSPGLQELTCMRLALAGHCRYVIWMEPPQRTLIVHPKHVYDKTLRPEAFCVGFNHRWLLEQIRKAHEV